MALFVKCMNSVIALKSCDFFQPLSTTMTWLTANLYCNYIAVILQTEDMQRT